MRIEVTKEVKGIAIRFDDVLHAWIDRPKLLGVTAWRANRQFFIEFAVGDGVIRTDYDTEKKWRTILGKLDEVLTSRPAASRRTSARGR